MKPNLHMTHMSRFYYNFFFMGNSTKNIYLVMVHNLFEKVKTFVHKELHKRQKKTDEDSSMQRCIKESANNGLELIPFCRVGLGASTDMNVLEYNPSLQVTKYGKKS